MIPELVRLHGKENVIALGHNRIPESYDGPLEKADVKDVVTLRGIFAKHGITQVYHLAAILSVTGEENPNKAWEVNLEALKGIFDLCV